jgi:hypothetical protein
MRRLLNQRGHVRRWQLRGGRRSLSANDLTSVKSLAKEKSKRKEKRVKKTKDKREKEKKKSKKGEKKRKE